MHASVSSRIGKCILVNVHKQDSWPRVFWLCHLYSFMCCLFRIHDGNRCFLLMFIFAVYFCNGYISWYVNDNDHVNNICKFCHSGILKRKSKQHIPKWQIEFVQFKVWWCRSVMLWLPSPQKTWINWHKEKARVKSHFSNLKKKTRPTPISRVRDMNNLRWLLLTQDDLKWLKTTLNDLKRPKMTEMTTLTYLT